MKKLFGWKGYSRKSQFKPIPRSFKNNFTSFQTPESSNLYSLLGQHPYDIITITNESKIPAKIIGFKNDPKSNVRIYYKLERNSSAINYILYNGKNS